MRPVNQPRRTDHSLYSLKGSGQARRWASRRTFPFLLTPYHAIGGRCAFRHPPDGRLPLPHQLGRVLPQKELGAAGITREAGRALR